MTEAQELNQKLDKMQLPLGKLDLDVEVEGIFSFPQEWKTTDEANPSLFTYTAKFCTVEFTGGKIVPRKQTERQLREQQEVTKKKPGKKQSKMDPAEQERIRKQKQQDAEQDRKKQEEFDKLSEEDKVNATSEDPYKNASLKFEKNKEKIELTGSTLVLFEQRMIFDKGEWIYVYKYPAVSEEETNKLKKGKPKNLNLNDLNPIVMRAWVDYSKLAEPRSSELRVRCQLKQVDETAETSKPNLEKTYILVKLNLSEPMIKDHDEHELTSKDLIKPPPTEPPTPLDIESVSELREQIRLALESIAMEYSNSFWKQLNFVQEQKNINTLAVPKKADINRRKQQFLYEFNMTGKYRILKERLKKVIVKICKYKYAGVLGSMTSFTGVSTEAKDQFYSQLYNFLVSTTQQTLQGLISSKKEELGVTSVPSCRQQAELIDKYIRERIDESVSEKAARLCSEYEDVRDIESAKQTYSRLMEAQPENSDLKIQYSKFCLRNKIGSPFPQKVISMIYECLRHNRESIQLRELYCYLLMSTKKKAECRQAWVILNELLNTDPNNVKLLMLCSFLFGSLLNEENLGQKYLKLAERIQLRELKANLPKLGNHNIEPAASETPTLKGVCEYNITLKDSQRDQLYLNVMRQFSKYNLFNLVEILLPRIKNKQSDQMLLLNIKTELFKGNTKVALDKNIELCQKSLNLTTAELVTQIAFQLKNFPLCEEYLKKCLRYPEVINSPAVYIRLAYINLETGKYANSKACLVKLLQVKPNYCLGWLKLGITELLLGNYDAAVNCLRQANLLNPENLEAWLSLAQVYTQLGKLGVANQCLISYSRIESSKGPNSRKRAASPSTLQRLRNLLINRTQSQDDREPFTSMLRILEQLNETSTEHI